MFARHPVLVAFGVAFLVAALLVILRLQLTGPLVDVLNLPLRYWFVAIPMLIVGVAARRFVPGAGPGWVALQVIGAIVLGLFLGYALVGLATCAFCTDQ
jgi:hypothetical protein